MSFYRSFIVAVAAMGLATSVFAADEAASTTSTTTTTTEAPAVDTQAAAPAGDASATTTTTTTETTAAAEEKVDLNKATVKDLMKVKGLNAAKAKAIVSYRKKHGDFKSIDDLKEVKGFKKMNAKIMKKLEEQLTVG
jgi:competence protein ComEA